MWQGYKCKIKLVIILIYSVKLKTKCIKIKKKMDVVQVGTLKLRQLITYESLTPQI